MIEYTSYFLLASMAMALDHPPFGVSMACEKSTTTLNSWPFVGFERRWLAGVAAGGGAAAAAAYDGFVEAVVSGEVDGEVVASISASAMLLGSTN
jgi:hypothetical protein